MVSYLYYILHATRPEPTQNVDKSRAFTVNWGFNVALSLMRNNKLQKIHPHLIVFKGFAFYD